jgi:hypothetical protein
VPIKNENIIFFNIPVSFSTKIQIYSAPKNAFFVAEPRSAGNSAPKSALFVAEPGTEPGAEWGDGDGFVGKNIIFVVIQEIIFKN